MRPTQIVEATLFASQSPLTPREVARADESLTVEVVRTALAELHDEYEEQDRAFQIYSLGDGYQILTRPEYAPYLERFDSVPRSPGLSAAALETLAIIAYRQPISRIEIEEIRGVGSSTVLRTLQEWELIGVVGRGEGLGRPLLYGTTKRMLDHFGFRDLSDLPRLEDLPVTLQVEEQLEIPPGAEEAQEATGAEEATGAGEAAAAQGAEAPAAETDVEQGQAAEAGVEAGQAAEAGVEEAPAAEAGEEAEAEAARAGTDTEASGEPPTSEEVEEEDEAAPSRDTIQAEIEQPASV